MLLARTVVRSTGRLATRSYGRTAVVQEPTMHNATGKWDALKAKRPIDHDDEHVST